VLARFSLGEWDGALADQAELERAVGETPRELPPGFTMRAYACAALCHELRGNRDEADRYIALVRRYLGGRDWPPGSLSVPSVALALARRGRFDEALELVPFVPKTVNATRTLEALCEISAMRGRWEEATELAATARAEAEVGEQLPLPLYADRLEGRAAAAAGDVGRGADLLRGSAEGFASLAARWEEACSRLLLAEALFTDHGEEAEAELAAALPVFERLRSADELERSRSLRAAATVRPGQRLG
jgi:hypothetical protein